MSKNKFEVCLGGKQTVGGGVRRTGTPGAHCTHLTGWVLALVATLCLILPAAPTQAQRDLTPTDLAVRKAAEEERKRRAEEQRRIAAEAEAARATQAVKLKDEELARLREQLRQSREPPASAPVPAAQKAVTAPPASRYRAMEGLLQVPGCEACGQLSAIEAGEFDMGSPDTPGDEPQRRADEGPMRLKLKVARFEVGRTEVTQGQWKAVTGSNPSYFNNCGDACPVETVSWDDITGPNGFLARLNAKLGLSGDKAYRLLTEAEWEYAARAGTKTPFWWGSGISPKQANYDGNYVYAGGGEKGEYRQRTVKADAFVANAWGLYNVHGNVYEWVQDCWHGSYAGAPTTAAAWETGCAESRRVVRGGSWFNDPQNLRSASRGWNAPVYRIYVIGFRLARTF